MRVTVTLDSPACCEGPGRRSPPSPWQRRRRSCSAAPGRRRPSRSPRSRRALRARTGSRRARRRDDRQRIGLEGLAHHLDVGFARLADLGNVPCAMSTCRGRKRGAGLFEQTGMMSRTSRSACSVATIWSISAALNRRRPQRAFPDRAQSGINEPRAPSIPALPRRRLPRSRRRSQFRHLSLHNAAQKLRRIRVDEMPEIARRSDRPA